MYNLITSQSINEADSRSYVRNLALFHTPESRCPRHNISQVRPLGRTNRRNWPKNQIIWTRLLTAGPPASPSMPKQGASDPFRDHARLSDIIGSEPAGAVLNLQTKFDGKLSWPGSSDHGSIIGESRLQSASILGPQGRSQGGKGGKFPPPETEKIVVEKWCYFRKLYF